MPKAPLDYTLLLLIRSYAPIEKSDFCVNLLM